MTFAADDDQPFATATLAQIYRGQGRLLQARSIYEQLLREQPDDAQALRGLEQVQAELAALLAQAAGGEETLALAASAEGLALSWSVTARGLERARLVLGAEGDLILRLVGFPFDPGLSLRDHPIDALTGSRSLPPPTGARVACAAVGMLADDGRFAAIAHGDPLPLALNRTSSRSRPAPTQEL